jgi:hypothetical protein
LAGIVDFAKLIFSALNVGFKELAIKKSEFNAFVSANIMTATVPNAPDPAAITYADLIVSKGSLGETELSSIVADVSEGDIVLTWPTTTTGAGQASTDRAYAVLVNTTTGGVQECLSIAARSAGTFSVTPSSSLGFTAGNVIRAFFFFSRLDGTKSSNSTTTTTTVIA